MAILYITSPDSSGWLVVRFDDNDSTYPPLPQYTKVKLIKSQNRRDYFKILEGKNIDRKASFTRQSNGNSYLAESSHDPFGKVYYNRTKGELWWGNMNRSKSGIECQVFPQNLPEIGVFDLEIPYEVHIIGHQYTNITPYATTWFKIGHAGDKFLHPGLRSAGRVTVREINEWDGI